MLCQVWRQAGPLPEKDPQKQAVEECQLLPSPFVFCHLDHMLSPMLSAKMRLAGETFCRESTSSNASKLAAAGRCFPSPAMPKATTTGTPSVTVQEHNSGMFQARNAKGNYDWNA